MAGARGSAGSGDAVPAGLTLAAAAGGSLAVSSPSGGAEGCGGGDRFSGGEPRGQGIDRFARKPAGAALVEHVAGGGGLAAVDQRRDQREPILADIRIGIDRRLQVRQSGARLADLAGELAQVVVGIGVVGRLLQDRAVERFGFTQPTRLVMGDGVLQQRGGIKSHRRCGRRERRHCKGPIVKGQSKRRVGTPCSPLPFPTVKNHRWATQGSLPMSGWLHTFEPPQQKADIEWG